MLLKTTARLEHSLAHPAVGCAERRLCKPVLQTLCNRSITPGLTVPGQVLGFPAFGIADGPEIRVRASAPTDDAAS